MDVKVAVCLNYDLNNDRKKRRQKCALRPEWWARRAELLETLILPALERQTLRDFDLWGLFLPEDDDRSAKVRMLIEAWGGRCVYGGQDGANRIAGCKNIRAHYAEHLDAKYLLLVLMDSDDVIAPDTLEAMVHGEQEPGRVWQLCKGVFARLSTGQVYNFERKQLPAYGLICTRESIASEKAWVAYYKKWGFNHGAEHQIKCCPRHRSLKGRRLCVTDHDRNMRPDLENNKGLQKRVGVELGGDRLDAERKRFGLTGWKREHRLEGYFGTSKTKPRERKFLLANMPDKGHVLEIGTFDGVTCAILADNSPDVSFLCVDIFRTTKTTASGQNGNWLLNRRPNMNLFVGTLQELTERFPLNVKFDAAFVDGDHCYKNVRADLFALNKLMAFEGTILCHDYHSRRKAGVIRAVNEFCEKTGLWNITGKQGSVVRLQRSVAQDIAQDKAGK